MNKTFKDPNTKYSDQGTPVSQAKSVADSIASVEQAVTGLGTGVATLAEEVTSLEQAIAILPVPEATDDGKVVTATNDGGYTLADVDALPAISAGDAGKVLTVNAGETGAEWSAASGGGALTWHNASIQVTASMYQNAAQKKNASTGSVPQVTKAGSSVTVTDVTKCGLGIQYTPTNIIEVVSGTVGSDTVYKAFCVMPFLERTTTAIKPSYLVICLSELDDNWTTTSGTGFRSFYWFSEE